MKVKELRADYKVIPNKEKNVGWVRPEAVTHQDKTVGYAALTHPTSTLGELCRTTSGGTPSRKNPAYFSGSIPWVKSGELPDGPVIDVEEAISEEALRNSSAKLFPAGTLLIALYGATVGKLGILTKAAATNQAVCAVFPGPKLDNKFLFWFLRFRRSDLIAQAVGGAQPNISQGIIRNLEIPAPPLDQQKRIVAEIEKQFSRLDEAVVSLKRVKANLKRYKAAVLKAAVEGRLVETEAELARREGRSYETGEQLLQRILETRRSQWQGKGKYKEPAVPDTTGLSELPEGWVWATVEQVNLANRPCAYGVLQPGDDLADGIPFVRVGDISDGRIGLSALKRISPQIAAQYPRTKLVGGEFLITLVGAIGRTALVPVTLAGANVARAVGVVPLTEEIDAHWFEIWFRNPDKVVEMTSKSHEVARKTLNLEDVRAASVAVPPLAEQHRIVTEVDRRLSLVRETETQVDANLRRAERLRQSILSRAFSGGLAGAERAAA